MKRQIRKEKNKKKRMTPVKIPKIPLSKFPLVEKRNSICKREDEARKEYSKVEWEKKNGVYRQIETSRKFLA